MIQMRVVCLLLVARICATFDVHYYGYKVFEIIPTTAEEARVLHGYASDDKLDFWHESKKVGLPTHIMVAPEHLDYFESEMIKNRFNFTIVVSDVERIIQEQPIERSLSRSLLGQVTFSQFMFYDEQMAYLRRVAAEYPDITTLETIGYSLEGREILLLRVSSGVTDTEKPTIFMDAGIHCREWIAPPVALYTIQQLVENPSNAQLYENVDWVIVPNANPDGYEFTMSNNRLWRKNRRFNDTTSCYGTDLNRNFGYYWMYDGASDNPCSDIYAGTAPFSEPETQALQNYILAHNDSIKLYLAIHSYGEMFLYPWGYAPEYPDDADELQYVGDLAAAAIEAESTINSKYVVENSAILLYAAAGAADDWAKGVAGIQLSYTIELPNGDAPYWFMIPARQILPVVQETFAGLRALHGYIEEKFWNEPELILRNQAV